MKRTAVSVRCGAFRGSRPDPVSCVRWVLCHRHVASSSSSSPSTSSTVGGLSSQYFTYLIESATPYISSILRLKLDQITPGNGSLILKCRPELHDSNAKSLLHGGAIVGAIDHSAGLCAWSGVDSHTKIVSTINLEISYFNSLNIDSEELICEAAIASHDENFIRTDITCWNSSKTTKIASGRCLFNVYHHKPLPANVVYGLNQLFVHPLTSKYGPLLMDTLRDTVMVKHRVQHSVQSVYTSLTSQKSTSLLPPSFKPSNPSITHESVSGYAQEILRLRYRSIDPLLGKLVVILPYRDEFTGNFSSPCLHGGVLGSVLDHCGHHLAGAIISHQSDNDQSLIATPPQILRNDYRVDYLLPAPCFEDLICECTVTARGENMIWIDGVCWNKKRTKKLCLGRMSYLIDRMGCSSSKDPPRKPPPKPVTLTVPSSSGAPTPVQTPGNTANHVPHHMARRPSQSPLSDNEIQSRIESPLETQVCTIGDIRYRYAWVSQRGYYPREPNKENQDSYTILPEINKIENGAFFAVYDGHGEKGHLCSRYVRDKLPGAISYFVGTALKENSFSPEVLCPALRDSHRSVNQLLIDSSSINVTLSGTTSISILFCGRKMCVSNVGDSRAIIVSEDETGKLKALPLSSDQTPYRKDERERVKSHGARVLSSAQIEGLEPIHENWGEVNLGEEIDEGGDPPRVWSPNGTYPGVAFTRSFGDLFAKVLGVHEEPEILIRDVQPNDRYIILASDGVFEFLTNQMVADMISQRSDPLDACRAIVAQSYELWLQYEVRTDDITIIALFVEGNEHLEPTHHESVAADGKLPAHQSDMQKLDEMTNKPVRRTASREKKKTFLQALDNSGIIVSRSESRKQLAQYKVPKTEEEQAQMLLAMSDNILFHHLTEIQKLSLIEMIQRVPVKKNDVIIKQGDIGDRFYIVGTGTYEVRVKSDLSSTSDGIPVHVYESGPSQHPCFGELALMYGKPRAASVVALSDGMLWAIDKFVFVNSLMRSQALRKEILRSLKRVKAFRTLRISQLQRLVDLINEGSFMDGQVIINEGDEGTKFYIIVEGTCRVSKVEDGQEIEVGTLTENDYFGEVALLTAEPHQVTVTALTYVEVLTIEKSGFEEVLGDLKEFINRKNLRNPMSNGPKSFEEIQLACFVTTDVFGSLGCGMFNSSIPNVSIKTYILDSKDFESVKDDIMTAVEGARAMGDFIENNGSNCYSLPLLLASFCEQNSFHMVFNDTVVSNLEAWSQYLSSTPTGKSDLVKGLQFVAACVVSAIDAFHRAGIIYRSVQPECIHINDSGKVILFDYGVSKVGCVGGKTYTLCGVPDYLAPEQLTQRGHNEAVDFWQLGVLLYELLALENPFSSGKSNDLGIMLKIAQYGKSSFSELPFPEIFPPALIALINSLVVPKSDQRLGMLAGGIDLIRSHGYFEGISWSSLQEVTSPLADYAKDIHAENLREGIPTGITEKWNLSDPSSSRVRSASWMEDLLDDLS